MLRQFSRYFYKFTVVIFLLITIAACNTLPDTAPEFIEAPIPVLNDKTAVLYVYRVFAAPIVWSPSIEVDKQPYVSLPNHSFSWFYVTPGEHEVYINWPFLSGAPGVRFKQQFEPGKTYAYVVGGNVSAGYKSTTVTSTVQQVNLETAIEIMQDCCRYLPAEKISND